MLQELYPDTKIVADAESSRVLVWTTSAEHEQIEQAVRQMDAPAAAGKNKMVYYRLDEIDARDVLEMLEELAPSMSLVADRDSNSIIAWGSEKDHALLKKTAEDFRQQAEVGGRPDRQLSVWQSQHARSRIRSASGGAGCSDGRR